MVEVGEGIDHGDGGGSGKGEDVAVWADAGDEAGGHGGKDHCSVMGGFIDLCVCEELVKLSLPGSSIYSEGGDLHPTEYPPSPKTSDAHLNARPLLR